MGETVRRTRNQAAIDGPSLGLRDQDEAITNDSMSAGCSHGEFVMLQNEEFPGSAGTLIARFQVLKLNEASNEQDCSNPDRIRSRCHKR